jgi:4-hydroxy-2-oxoheptanedioate aldolase
MAMSGFKQRLQNGGVLGGYINMIPSAISVQVMAAAGADWIAIDQEHAPIGPEALHTMITATAGTNCSPVVRVPKADEAWVKPALDSGAEGICFPHVSTAEEAAYCASLIHYPPRGRRGFGPLIAAARWRVALPDYIEQMDDDAVCMALIETKAGVDNIESICRVEGVDCLMIAPYDLSTELGVPGRFDAPEFRDAVTHLESVILKAGIPLGSLASTRDQTRDLIKRGYRLPLHGCDILMLTGIVRQTEEWRRLH